MDGQSFFWSVIIFYFGVLVGVMCVGLGHMAKDHDPHNDVHGM